MTTSHSISCAMLAALAAACASSTSGTRFLDDYSVLRPSEAHPDDRSWLSPDAGHYGELLVPPFVVCFDEQAAGRPVDVGALDDALTRLRGALIDALDDRYFLAAAPGDGVMRLEVAVTELCAGGAAQPGLRSANVELRGVDSETDEVVFAAFCRRPFVDAPEDLDAAWLASRAGMWVQRIMAELDSAEVEVGS